MLTLECKHNLALNMKALNSCKIQELITYYGETKMEFNVNKEN